eukprot:6672467-Alexandrium_andersonii.AAC.1
MWSPRRSSQTSGATVAFYRTAREDGKAGMQRTRGCSVEPGRDACAGAAVGGRFRWADGAVLRLR